MFNIHTNKTSPMYTVVLEWLDEDMIEPETPSRFFFFQDAAIAMDFANKIARDEETYKLFEQPKNIYLYKINCIDKVCGNCDYHDIADTYFSEYQVYTAAWLQCDKYVKIPPK